MKRGRGAKCTLDGCERDLYSLGWCLAHYTRVRRTGSTGSPEVWDKKRPTCSVEGCEEPHRAHGYCLNHGRRVAKGGHPDYIAPLRFGEANTSWKGEDAGYGAAHMRVYAARGSARSFACVSCGEPARHWSYNHSDPSERYADGRSANPLPYSVDPAHYSPRCVPCHYWLDRWHSARRQGLLTHEDILAGLRETREADQAHRFAEALGRAR